MSLFSKLYSWTFEWVNQKHFFISPYHIGRRNFLWFFAYILQRIETLDVPLMILKNMEKIDVNQCKLVVISKIWPFFWIKRDFGYVTNWSTQPCNQPYGD
jgi:hypothetical protein